MSFSIKYTTWCLNHSLKHAYRPRKIKYVKFTCRSKITILKYKQNTIFHLPWLVKVYIIISEEVHVRHRHQAKCPSIFFLFNFLQNVSKNKNKNNQLKIVQVFVRSKLYFFNKMNCSSNSSNRFICKTISYIPEAILFTSIKLKFSYELM